MYTSIDYGSRHPGDAWKFSEWRKCVVFRTTTVLRLPLERCIHRGRSPRWINTSPRGLKITCLYSTWTRLTGGTMTNRCFCSIRGEYEFTVLLLLSGAIKYIPPKQRRKTSHVEYKLSNATMSTDKFVSTYYSAKSKFRTWCL